MHRDTNAGAHINVISRRTTVGCPSAAAFLCCDSAVAVVGCEKQRSADVCKTVKMQKLMSCHLSMQYQPADVVGPTPSNAKIPLLLGKRDAVFS